MCSFCVIPFARGRSRYREYSNLLKEAHFLVKEGAREIVITGVNIGTYKNDNFNFVNVVDSLNSIEGLDRIRISSIEPTTVPKILLEYMRDSQHKLVPYFHLPLQSGSDNILKKMNRRYSSSEFSEEIWKAYDAVPDICLGTDVMVGFPEEDETDRRGAGDHRQARGGEAHRPVGQRHHLSSRRGWQPSVPRSPVSHEQPAT